MVSPQAKRQAVEVLQAEHRFGVTRACGLIAISRSLYRYRSRRPDCAELRRRKGEIAAQKRRYGYRRIHVLLRREGWEVNRKKTYRLYRELGLAVRRRKRKRIGPFERVPLPKPTAANQSWSMDFIADGLADGRKLRCLAVVDDYSRECVVIEVDTSITGTRVAAVLDRIAVSRGLPASITVDHGPEFEGQVLDAWAYARGVRLSFIRPGKPVENAYIESFNGKFRDECLNEHWFVTMAHAYTPSPRAYRVPDPPRYPFHDRTVLVTRCGRICIGNRKINLSTVFAGQFVGIREVADKIWLVSFLDFDLGFFDEVAARVEPGANPFASKVLTMCPV